MNLALFDFDGTITKKDSMIDFIQFIVGTKEWYLGLFKLSPMLLLYAVKIMSNHRAKELLLTHFFKGFSEDMLQNYATIYTNKKIDTIIRDKALKRVLWHKNRGDRVVVITASASYWVKPWCDKMKLELIATELEVIEGKISGKIVGKNCYGVEKLHRCKRLIDLNAYKEVYVYGDSSGDKALLSVATQGYYKPFED